MDVRNFAGFKKKLAKESNKKETGTQKPVDEFLPREAEPSSAVPADAEAGGIQAAAAATKRKAMGKGVVPVGKKPKKGDAGKKAPLVLIVDEHSSSEPPVGVMTVPSNPPPAQLDEGGFPRENVQFSLVKGTTIMHGTVDPMEFLRGATPELDRAALSRLDDETLDSKILRSSLTACIALGKQVQRVEESRLQKAQQDETLTKLVHDNAAAVREMARLEETLRQERVEAKKADAGIGGSLLDVLTEVSSGLLHFDNSVALGNPVGGLSPVGFADGYVVVLHGLGLTTSSSRFGRCFVSGEGEGFLLDCSDLSTRAPNVG
ncbi:unnamed protein product [Cuscuta europaea]|nr:unnamed protein product [Cuscuta europaea]